MHSGIRQVQRAIQQSHRRDVPHMRESNKVIAILCADIHLQHKAPVWRSAEDDWYEAMRRPLKEITDLGYTHNCPIIIAGDIFTKWNSCPELINFALTYLPSGAYCIPGQHDLPNHQIKDIEKSAYQTLIKAGKITDFKQTHLNIAHINAFPFGTKLTASPSATNTNGSKNTSMEQPQPTPNSKPSLKVNESKDMMSSSTVTITKAGTPRRD